MKTDINEKYFWEIRNSLKLVNDTSPLNLTEEKIKFLDFNKNGQNYNPIFEYKNNDYNKEIKEINELHKLFLRRKDFIGLNYSILAKNLIRWMSLFRKRNEAEFGKKLINLFSIPSKSLQSFALKILVSTGNNTSEKLIYSHRQLKNRINKHLIKLNISGWEVVFKEMPAKMSINNFKKHININKFSRFGAMELERLKIHEIGVHVARYENGIKQKNLIYAKGFPNYLETEEGLAILSEKKTNLLSNKYLVRYAIRVILAAACISSDFSTLYKFTNKFFDSSESFDIVARIKRGMIDTSRIGGYTKDLVYLKGYLAVKNLPPCDLAYLFIGKIGIDQLEQSKKLSLSSNILLPDWLKKEV